MKSAKYYDQFYDHVDAHAVGSAQVVVPIVQELISPKSVLDVGCGRGAWLRAFELCGVTDIRGMDGDYLNRSKLLIHPDRFTVTDLCNPPRLEQRYDLALCLEVAEHLADSRSARLVEFLTNAAPFVLFSAAIPGQGGVGHVNEQWPSYWQKLFQQRGFMMLDVIRPRIRDDNRVQWWYRQNLFLLASDERLSRCADLARAAACQPSNMLEWVHVDVFKQYLDQEYLLRAVMPSLLCSLPRLYMRKLKRRFERFARRTSGNH
jgi:SAM-dependent methyltransferase